MGADATGEGREEDRPAPLDSSDASGSAPLGLVYAVAGAKGGVGKTTTAANLAAMFGSGERSVVVVDTDLATASLTDQLDLSPPRGDTLHAVLAGDVGVESVVTSLDGFDVVPGDGSVAAFAGADVERLRPAVETLRERYDVVVLDVGAGLSHDTAVPLGLADRVLVVTTPANAAVAAAEKTRVLAERLDCRVEGCVVTSVRERADIEPVRSGLDAPVLAAIPHDPAVDRSHREGVPVTLTATGSAAATAYWNLSRRGRPGGD
ncbi:MinD/ParA family ATP-binding protein [Halomarina litorea]|uniref:MinD/ParA family ATP-binding protein n=1 Tax=Halomarina litorea TaxID=2961595 RepID=UPI0020C28CDF|nr:MinD/ParA family protein [Halomarina sp. BCD28]